MSIPPSQMRRASRCLHVCILGCVSLLTFPYVAVVHAEALPTSAVVDLMVASQPSLPLEPHPNYEPSSFDERLIGYWEHRGQRGIISLEITSEHDLRISGQPLKFETLPGILRVTDNETGDFEYPYTLQNNHLVLTLTDVDGQSYEFSFERVNLGDSTTLPQSQSTPVGTQSTD